ncbi:MAG: carbohydrate kinase family protein [Actinobacteria bacterium]|nr:carbohydrate kinase family protein [Actinomycetota bacterium]MCL6087556.1 carbohydrate kinase family protein [Actinomycetota bacterium]
MENNKKNTQFDVAGFGIATLDYICLVDEVANFNNSIFISDVNFFGGGVVPTALVALQRLGGKSAFVTSLGKDWTGKEIIKGLKKEKIDCSGVDFVDNIHSPFSFVQVTRSLGERAIAFYPGSSSLLKFTERAKYLISKSKILHLDGLKPEENLKAAEFARKHGLKVMIDTNKVMEGTKRLLANADYLILPQSFLYDYTGLKDIKDALLRIKKEYDPEILVVTIGIEGSLALVNNGFLYVKTFKEIERKDTTGAGDVYHGAFLFGIIHGWSVKDIMVFSSAASSIKCMSYGGRNGIPNFDATMRFLKEHDIDIKNFRI